MIIIPITSTFHELRSYTFSALQSFFVCSKCAVHGYRVSNIRSPRKGCTPTLRVTNHSDPLIMLPPNFFLSSGQQNLATFTLSTTSHHNLLLLEEQLLTLRTHNESPAHRWEHGRHLVWFDPIEKDKMKTCHLGMF